jgi:hypothetical protein
MEEPPRSTSYPDKYSLKQYLVDKPDPELKPVLHLIRLQVVREGGRHSWTKDQLSSISTGKA